MQPLVTNQRVFIWLSITHDSENTSKLKQFLYSACTVASILELTFAISGSVLFFLKNASTNLEEALYALFQISGLFGSLYMLIVGIILRHQIMAIFEKLSEIYSAHKNDGSFEFLVQVNNRCEWVWKMYFIYLLGGFVVSSLFLVFVSAVYCWFTVGHFDASILYHIHKVSLPWDQDTVVGYGFSTLFDLLSCEFYFFLNGSFLLLFLSICLHHGAFLKMFQSKLSNLDFPTENYFENQNNKKILSKLIRFHVRTKEWFLHSSDVYRHFVLIQLLSSAAILTCVIFQLDLQFKDPDIRLGLLFCGVLISGGNLFIYCYYGKLATESYANMSDCLYGANWQQLPIKMQKYFIVMIANGQRPLHYNGFGIAVLDLQTFCALLRAVSSYYMAFKTLTE